MDQTSRLPLTATVSFDSNRSSLLQCGGCLRLEQLSKLSNYQSSKPKKQGFHLQNSLSTILRTCEGNFWGKVLGNNNLTNAMVI